MKCNTFQISIFCFMLGSRLTGALCTLDSVISSSFGLFFTTVTWLLFHSSTARLLAALSLRYSLYQASWTCIFSTVKSTIITSNLTHYKLQADIVNFTKSKLMYMEVLRGKHIIIAKNNISHFTDASTNKLIKKRDFI